MTSLLSATNPAFDVVVDDIGVGGGVFNDLLHTLCRDLIELKSFLAVLIHFLNAAIRARSLLHCAGSEISTQTSFSCSDKPLTELVLNIEPTVVVIDTDRVNRMKCPSCSVISSHSTQLAGMISVNVLLLCFAYINYLSECNGETLAASSCFAQFKWRVC